MKKIIQIFVPLLAISACTTADIHTHASFQTPSNIGYLGPNLTGAVRGNDITPAGDGYAYAVGAGANKDFYGYAGIVPTTVVSTPPTTGSATWAGTYKLEQITGIELTNNGIQGYKAANTGTLSLAANFGAGTLIGSSAVISNGITPDLTVNGTFVGSALSGAVTFRGLTGALTGLVGATGAVGAFQGNGATDLYAGGFMVGTP